MKPSAPTARAGPGLFAYLRGLQGANGATTAATSSPRSSRACINRMINGYLLRDVINKVDGIHFTSIGGDPHPRPPLRDACCARCATRPATPASSTRPRPVVRFMVEVDRPAAGRDRARPRLRHRRLPGRGLQPPGASSARPSRTASVLQETSICGGEAKPLPYLLGQMNLLLHGLEYPQIDSGNSLRFPPARDRRPRPGGRDPHQSALRRRGGGGHPGQLPRGQADRRDGAAVPAAHHAQAQAPGHGRTAGRAAVVVPNGTLFGDGVCARIKEELLKEFNLHTIVRLPNGVFAPYTSIPTNLLFFDRSGPTKDDLVLRASPARGPQELHQDQAAAVRGVRRRCWRGGTTAGGERPRLEGQRSRTCSSTTRSGNLLSATWTSRTPTAGEALEHLPPEELVAEIVEKERRIMALMEEIAAELEGGRDG